jgi:hypothetical protein
VTSTHQTLPYQPDFAALLTNLATHREQAEHLLSKTGPITYQGTLVQAAIAHALTGLLLVAEGTTAARAAQAAPTAEVPTEPVPDPVVEDARPPRTTARVRVFHNNHPREAFPGGYVPGQSVTEVYACDETDVGPDVDDRCLADRAFQLFNVGDDPAFGEPDPRALVYRERGNRSLSVGDVVGIDDRFYSCDSFGWSEMTERPLIQQQHNDGTTPLY